MAKAHTVGDLKAVLAGHADTDLVLLSSDSEGNRLSGLGSIGKMTAKEVAENNNEIPAYVRLPKKPGLVLYPEL